MEEPPKKYFRLFPGNEVRLMNAYFVKCVDYKKDENGNVTEIHCTYDPETRSGSGFLQDVKLREQSIGYQQDMVLSQKSDYMKILLMKKKAS